MIKVSSEKKIALSKKYDDELSHLMFHHLTINGFFSQIFNDGKKLLFLFTIQRFFWKENAIFVQCVSPICQLY
jgi:hypothetical protein